MYQAIALDLDGTLLDSSDRVRPATLAALRSLEARGIAVVVATGRSMLGTRPVLAALALRTPAVVFNGAGIYCPVEARMLEERVLANETRRRALAFAVQGGHFAVTQRVDGMFTTEPTDAAHADVITKFEGVHVVAPAELDCEYAMRVTLFSGEHESSAALARELEEHLARPAFLTHFPLDQLPSCRGSELSVVDVHPPCRGKAEALRYLWEERGIDPRAVVAVGDATNDLELFEAAGLGVAMEHSMPELLAVADRVIGSNDSDAIAELVAELFPQ